MADPKPQDMLALSDDDFAKLNEPDIEAAPAAEAPAKTEEELAAEAAAATAAAEANAGDAGGEEELTDAEKAAQASDGEDDGTGTEGDDPSGSGEAEPKAGEGEAETEEAKAAREAAEAETAAAAKDKPGESDKQVAAPADRDKPDETALASFYNQIMTPFKANGKTIELKTPEEAIQLMQMGANYTRKLQAIQPQRKLLLLLEKNNLLDEGKLSFLIDLDRKDPAAIRQLVKDSGIDPIDIDVSEDSAYRPGNHQVTDEEANFREVVGELSSNPTGKETIAAIHDTWDQTSKEALWGDPNVLKVIHEQRESGVYDVITAEMDRQITLGQIPANTPFLEAYKKAGDDLVAATVANQPEGSGTGEATPAGEKSAVVATRAAKPKSDLANDDKAKAASGTRSSPKAAKVAVNPLAESDEAFMKQMEGRL